MGQVVLDLRSNLTMDEVESVLASLGIESGGSWAPKHCRARHQVAILVPYRDRYHHLMLFLINMHPIFVRQEIAYKVYVIEPVVHIKFNRGLLLNIGFAKSNEDSNDKWQCHVFHDVDLLSEDDRTPFTCPSRPYHLAHFQSRYNYTYVRLSTL